ncbi:MAG: PAS domain S-box protein, partial [Bacteroidota bacterium]
EQWAEFIGYTLEEVSPVSINTLRKHIHPADLERCKKISEKHFRGETDRYECELRMKHRDGSWIWILDRGKVISWTEDGRPLWMYGTYLNINESKEAEKQLKEKTELLENITDNISDLVSLTDLEGNLLFVGKSQGVLGYDADYVVGKNIMNYVHPEDYSYVVKEFNEFLQSEEESRKIEHKNIAKDGSDIWFETLGRVIKDEDGNPKQLLFSSRDITERKEAELILQKKYKELETTEEELRVSNEELQVTNQKLEKQKEELLQYKRAVEGVDYMIASVDADYKYLFVNSSFLKYHQLKEEEVVGYKAGEVLGEKKFNNNIKPYFDRSLKGEFIHFEMKTEYPEYGKVNLDISYYPLEKEEGIEGVVAVMRDITQYKKEEKEKLEYLREFEITLKGLGCNQVFRYRKCKDDQYVVNFSEGEIAESLNFTTKQVKGKTLAEVMGEENADKLKPYFSRAFEGETVEYDFQNGDRWFYTKLLPFETLSEGSVVEIIGISTEITQRKKTEQSLKESEEKHRFLFENMTQGVVYHDSNGEIFYANSSAANILGLTFDQLYGKTSVDPCWKAIHEDGSDFSGENHPAMASLKTGKPVYNKKMGVFNPQKNDYKWININSIPKFKENQTEPYQVIVTFEDITQRKESEEALKKSEQQFRQLFEQAAIGIFIADAHHNIVDVNEKALSILGYSREEMFHMKARNLIHPDDINKLTPNDNVKKMLSGEVLQTERRYCRKDGNYINVLINIGKIDTHESKNMHMVMFQDITERKQAEEELQVKNRISNSFIQSENESFYKEVLDVFREVFYSEYGFFGYINEKGDLVTESMTRDVWDECQSEDKTIVFPKELWIGLWGESLKKRKTLYKNGNLQIPEGHVKLTSAMAAPIMADDQLIGQIALANKENGYDYEDKKLIQRLCDYIAPLLYSKLKEEKYKQDLLKTKEKAEENEEKYKALVDNTPDFIYSLDLYSRHTAVNKSICQALNLDSKDIIGENHFELGFPKEIAKDWQEKHLQIFNTGKSMQFETATPMPDGTVKTYEAILTPIFDTSKNVVGIRGISRDITEQKNAEKELIKAKEKAEESDRLKSAFLANMSHEIRTPMNSIIGFSQILQESDYPKEQQKKFIDIIHSRTQHLLHIINDLVDVSKIEANQLTLNVQHFYLNNLMQELYSVFSNELTNRENDHIQLKLYLGLNYEESYIESDFNRFRQIMDNLLKNAVKFTEEGTIEFGYELWHEDKLLFYVKDSGVGIPKEQQEHIFERFRQVDDSSTRAYEGTGLGLTISKNLVVLLGGEMWLKSKEGEGSVFYFTLPYEDKSSKQSREEKKAEGGISNKEEKTLLLIEDDPTSREYMKALLEPNGLSLITCETGEEGYEAFINHPEIELILMDIKLPDTNGLEVARKIRASSDKNREVPIIAQTAYAMSGDDKKSMEAGCNDYISKPVDSKELLEKIGKFI